jgi:hypothetical protein
MVDNLCGTGTLGVMAPAFEMGIRAFRPMSIAAAADPARVDPEASSQHTAIA